eukprot:TRINITY_DN19173_c0_g1_i4.p1 TRINITY_DN19173_c0_g1~~TRINITY_DN19173_c0_g1_i4.p1  ORF type:complete len:248 (-),score=39.57 TRINITY_DN19173_c0_g1_i4:366-1109(-)
MVRTLRARPQEDCPFAQGSVPLHTNWGSHRDPVSNLHCAAPTTATPMFPTGAISAGIASERRLHEPDALDQFSGRSKRDLVWEQKKLARLGGAGVEGAAAGGRRRRQEHQHNPVLIHQPTALPVQMAPIEEGGHTSIPDDNYNGADRIIAHGRRKSLESYDVGSGTSEGHRVFGGAQPQQPENSRSNEIRQRRRHAEESKAAAWLAEAEKGLASNGNGKMNCHGSNCSSGGYRVLQPSGGASSIVLG